MRLVRALVGVRSRLSAFRPDHGEAGVSELDPLTGLCSYTGFLEAEESGTLGSGAIILFDLDHFRKINTALETSGGDRVLVEVAHRIQEIAPAGSVTARTGIDEFAILLPPDVDGRHFAARLVREVARPIDAGAEQLVVSISIGVAESDLAEGLEGRLRRAGSAMRHLREPERVRDADASVAVSPDLIRQRFTLERELREGLAAGQLRLFYQPIVDLQTHVADEFEALLRWNHPERGMLLPGDFLFDIASDSLLRDVGRWVLRVACTQGRAWQEQRPDRPLTIAVNLSSSQIRDSRFPTDVRRTLKETGFDPGSLCFEISESITLDEIESAVGLIRDLRSLGVRLALDDFGAGNAGWTLLRQSQVDSIKLDQSFIAVGAGRAPDNMRMVEALATFATQLGLVVSIEGVERAEQADAMRAVGIHQAQGFFFAPPQPPGKVEALLNNVPLRPVT